MTGHAPGGRADAPPPTGHEPAHVHARGVMWLAFAVVAGCALVVAAVFFMTGWLGMPVGSGARPVDALAAPPPKPRLQPDPEADLAAYTRQKRALLHDYRWLDREHGIARIPIERAMQLLARPAPAATAASDPERPSR